MNGAVVTDRYTPARVLLGFGFVAFLVAVLSIVDMYLPRPYDGVVLEADKPGELMVQQVVPGSGADQAGIRPGFQIMGIARSALRSPGHAAALLNEREIGESIPYLVRTTDSQLTEVQVPLGRRQIGDTSYLYACLLGFCFFFIGLFVLLNRPRLLANQLFFVLCSLFLVFLICRLRPASYSWIDYFVLNMGTAALLFLPPAFLHFFLVFPRPLWQGGRAPQLGFLGRNRSRRIALTILYLLPLLIATAVLTIAGRETQLISGAPAANWWVLAISIVVGLFALAYNARTLPPSRERQGAILVFLGSVFGLMPFVVLAVAFSSFLESDEFIFYGVVPLILVPLSFAYAIIRFQLLDVHVILRKSLLYTATTVLVTLFYAVGIAFFNTLFRGSSIANSPYFPIVFALTIVLLFEPLRRWIQVPIDRFFFARRARLQSAMVEMGEAFNAQLDPAAVVRNLVEKLPQLLDLYYAALYLVRGSQLERIAGPETLPATLPLIPQLHEHLRERGALSRLDELDRVRITSRDADRMIESLAAEGIEVVGSLASPRRTIGLVLLSGRGGRMPLESDELTLMRGLFHQASIALETGILLDERARQAELEREMEIAAAIQSSLLPARVRLGDQWDVAAVCSPARQVGGDFFAEIPGPRPGSTAVVYGDVSGKSVSGALMMMAAKEALHSIASLHPEPTELFNLANRRLYELGNRSFVALGYFASASDDQGLQYIVAGQPHPMKKTLGGVEELPLPEHRIPLGAMNTNGDSYQALHTLVKPGEIVVVYSDGVIEAQSPAGAFFGSERLAETLRRGPAEPRELVEHVLAEIQSFTAGTQPYDDVTLMAIGRRREVSS